MALGPKRFGHNWLRSSSSRFSGDDAASVFSFDSRVRRLTLFTRDTDEVRGGVERRAVRDRACTIAIASTVRTVSRDSPRGRAIVLLTDGMDTSSTLSPAEAASAAAALDMPLYVLAVGGDEPAGKISTAPEKSKERGTQTLGLNELAVRTGGLASEASTTPELQAVTRTILTELRHQYVLAIPAAPGHGWHELTVRVRQGRVRARSRGRVFRLLTRAREDHHHSRVDQGHPLTWQAEGDPSPSPPARQLCQARRVCPALRSARSRARSDSLRGDAGEPISEPRRRLRVAVIVSSIR